MLYKVAPFYRTKFCVMILNSLKPYAVNNLSAQPPPTHTGVKAFLGIIPNRNTEVTYDQQATYSSITYKGPRW